VSENASQTLRTILTRFVLENAQGAIAASLVFVLFRSGEWLFEFADRVLPVQASGPSEFLRLILSWGGSFATAATWMIVTIYQLAALRRALFARDTTIDGEGTR